MPDAAILSRALSRLRLWHILAAFLLLGAWTSVVVPLGEGGVHRGKPTDKIGQRALNQGEIFFDDLKVPADNLVVPPEGYRAAADRILCLANGGMGSTFVGCDGLGV